MASRERLGKKSVEINIESEETQSVSGHKVRGIRRDLNSWGQN